LSKKILITGGTGFIGYHLSKKCVTLGWSVTSISSKYPKLNKKIKGIKYLKIDITNQNKLNKINNNFDYVVNLAGYVDHSNKKKTLESHYTGCKNLASLFMNKKIKKFIQVGSCIEYGKLKSPQTENKKNNQSTYSVYGRAKLLSTKFLIQLNKKINFPSTIIRLYLVYGPRQDINRVIPITVRSALVNKKFKCSSGSQLRDFIFIDDVIEAIIKILKNKKTDGEIFNIGSNKPIKIKDLINKICQLVGSGKPDFGKVQMRKDEIMALYPNINKARRVLNWRPKISLNAGLKKTIKYYKNEKYR
tara:strand:+ start:176 stop:1087 length:912 start_codon:yes stop_codon:yes gene_type:complete